MKTSKAHRYMFTSTCANRFIEVSCGESWTQLGVFYRIFSNLHYFWLRRCRKVQRMRDVDGLGLRKRNVKEGALLHYIANRKRDERRVLVIYYVWKRIRSRARVRTFSTLSLCTEHPLHKWFFNWKEVPANCSYTVKPGKVCQCKSSAWTSQARERLNLERRWQTANHLSCLSHPQTALPPGRQRKALPHHWVHACRSPLRGTATERSIRQSRAAAAAPTAERAWHLPWAALSQQPAAQPRALSERRGSRGSCWPRTPTKPTAV